MTTKKRYQIFISSTYEDLPVERQEVFRAIMKMGHIPSGMEFFPAFGTTQLEYIKRIIDRSDYYVVISAGRYGSLTPEGISFTEAEYDYAELKQLPVIAMLHRNPEAIPVGKVQIDPDAQARLEAFKQRLGTNRGRGTYETPHELASEVVLALNEAFDSFPAVGWVRGDQAASDEVVRENLRLREENLNLRANTPMATSSPELAGLNDIFELTLSADGNEKHVSVAWGVMFAFLGPKIQQNLDEYDLRKLLVREYFEKNPNADLQRECMENIRIHLMALNLIGTTIRRMTGIEVLVWHLTDVGLKTLLALRSQKKPKADE